MLWCIRWKARVIQINLKACGIVPRSGPFFLIGFYFNLSRYFLRFLLGHFTQPIVIRPQDTGKLKALRISPSIFLTGHFHYWEALAAWLHGNAVPILGSARPLSSSVAQKVLEGLRRRLGVPVISHSVLTHAQAHLKAGRCFGILWDQFSRQSRFSSPLFGVPAAMDPLPDILIRRYSPAVWVGFLLPDGVFRLIEIQNPGRPLSNPEKLGRRYHRLLEKVIRANPGSWYGLCHARFKDSISYASGQNVSRETFSQFRPLEAKVSRETTQV